MYFLISKPENFLVLLLVEYVLVREHPLVQSLEIGEFFGGSTHGYFWECCRHPWQGCLCPETAQRGSVRQVAQVKGFSGRVTRPPSGCTDFLCPPCTSHRESYVPVYPCDRRVFLPSNSAQFLCVWFKAMLLVTNLLWFYIFVLNWSFPICHDSRNVFVLNSILYGINTPRPVWSTKCC